MNSYTDLINLKLGSLKAEPGEVVSRDPRNDLFDFSFASKARKKGRNRMGTGADSSSGLAMIKEEYRGLEELKAEGEGEESRSILPVTRRDPKKGTKQRKKKVQGQASVSVADIQNPSPLSSSSDKPTITVTPHSKLLPSPSTSMPLCEKKRLIDSLVEMQANKSDN